MQLRMALGILQLLLLSACGKNASHAEGAEKGACYGNGTCNSGLECRSEICVEGMPAGPANRSDDFAKALAAKVEAAAQADLARLVNKTAAAQVAILMEAAQASIDSAQSDMEAALGKLKSAVSEEERTTAIAARNQAAADLKAGRETLRRLKRKNLCGGMRVDNKCINSSDPLCGL